MLRINVDSRIVATVAAIVTFAAWTVNTIITSELNRLATQTDTFQTFISEIESKRNLDHSISTIKLALSKLIAEQSIGNDENETPALRKSSKLIGEIGFNAEFANQIFKHSSELLKISMKVRLEPAVLDSLRQIHSDIQFNYMKIEATRTAAVREIELIKNPVSSGNKIVEVARNHLNEIDKFYFNITKNQIYLLGLSNEVSRAVEVKRSRYLKYQGISHIVYIVLIVIASFLSIILKFKSRPLKGNGES